jgi:hypothetical protein
MDLNIEAWPEIIFKFGPYAILALFVLWVTPRASKRMQDITKTAPKAVRVSASITLFASWGVVLVMVGYVLFQWSPIRVYDGDLGILKQSERIYPLDSNLYVKVEGTQAPGRERWRFVLVDNERALRDEDMADFTYYWGNGENEYTDYSIPIGEILSGKINDYRFNKKDAEMAYVWSGGEWKLASNEMTPQAVAFDWGWNAYADDKLQNISEQLASPNRIERAAARSDMRKLDTQDLQQLKEMSNAPSAVHQIELEQQRRER